MLTSLIVTNGENFKEIEEPSLTALGKLEWNDPIVVNILRIYSSKLLLCLENRLFNRFNP